MTGARVTDSNRVLTRYVAFFIAIAALLVASNVMYYSKASKPSSAGTITRTAFLRWRDQIQGLSRGEDIYQKFHFPTPPIQALILAPFTFLPPMTGALIWLNLKVLMAAAAIIWAFRLCTESGRELPDWAKLVAVAFASHPILGDLSHGNVNIFIAFLVMGAMEAYRRGFDYLAGITLALSIACKLTPALFLPYFGWKWLWGIVLDRRAGKSLLAAAFGGPSAKVLGGCFVGLGIWWLVVPGAILGFDYNNQLLLSWYETMVRPFVVDGKVTPEEASQSIPGLFFRMLAHEPSVIRYDDNGKEVFSVYHNITDIGHDNVHLLIQFLQFVFIAVMVVLCRTRSANEGTVRQGLALSAEFAFILIGMLLFSERTWKHHGVTLLLPYAVLTACAAARPERGLREYIVATFAISGCLIFLPSLFDWGAKALMPHEKFAEEFGGVQDAALTYGSHTVVFILLAVAVCVVMRKERDPMLRESERA